MPNLECCRSPLQADGCRVSALRHAFSERMALSLASTFMTQCDRTKHDDPVCIERLAYIKQRSGY